MNVLITNNSEAKLSSLDIDIIKHITGTYSVKEIVDMFSTFFYNKMIIDVTALNNNKEIETFRSLAEGLDPDKLIIFLPEGSDFCTTSFLSNLISAGIYNFTTNLDGVKYLIKKSNTYKDVSHIQKLESTGATPTEKATSVVESSVSASANLASTTIGIKNATLHAGATSLIYMMTKELSAIFGKDKVLAVEVDRDDFRYFSLKNMVSVSSNDLRQYISEKNKVKIILIDLNKCNDYSMCNKIVYLLEPSTLQLNKMIDKNNFVLDKLKTEHVVLNKSLLSNKDVSDLESESGLKILYNIPPLNDRKRNDTIVDFLSRLGIIRSSNDSDKANKIFGLFRR
ncbi:MAG: hypothetical protein IJI43_04470 [Bacilli bacterium]|nr:hypothetical protein [Bacilli bacterium]